MRISVGLLVVVLAACGGGRGGDGEAGDELVETPVESCSSDVLRAMLECGQTPVLYEGCIGIGDACASYLADHVDDPACVAEVNPPDGWEAECEELARVSTEVRACVTGSDASTVWPEDPAAYACPCDFECGLIADEAEMQACNDDEQECRASH